MCRPVPPRAAGHGLRHRSSVVAAAWATVLSACTGGGSDIGPGIPPLAASSRVVTVCDDSGLPVVGALVTIEGVAGLTTGAGRADLEVGLPGGSVAVRLDPESGAAADGDALLGYTIALEADGGAVGQLPEVLHVADASASVGAIAAVGSPLGSAVVLDDTASSGALLRVPAGSVVGGVAASDVTLVSGRLGPSQIPGALPRLDNALPIVHASALLGPRGVTFSTAGDLEVPNDLGLAPGTPGVRLLALGEEGSWSELAVPGGVSVTATRLRANGVVTRTGLYAFAVPSPAAPIEVRGRVLDADGNPVANVLVRARQACAVTGLDGAFELPEVVGVDAGGASIAFDLELVGGRDFEPRGTTVSIGPVAPGSSLAAGDFTLDIATVGRFRGLAIYRGRAAPRTPFSISNTNRGDARFGVTDESGNVVFEDVLGDSTGYQLVALDPNPDLLRSAEGVLFVGLSRTVDLREFQGLVPLLPGGTALVTVLDEIGGGSAAGSTVLRDANNGDGPQLVANLGAAGGLPFAFGLDETITAIATTSESTAPADVLSAISVRRPRVGRLELPLRRARPAPFSSFDAHTPVVATIVSAPAGSPVRRVAVDGILFRRTWLDQVAFGSTVAVPRTPRDVIPATSADGDLVRLGVPTREANLSIAAGRDLGGGVFRLDAVGSVAIDDVPAAAEAFAVDVDLTRAAVDPTPLMAPAGAVGLDPRIGAASLRLDLAFCRGPERILLVDAARDVGGNHAVSGDALLLELPDLTAETPMGRDALSGQLVWIDGEVSLPDGSLGRQGQMLEFDADGAPVFTTSGFLPLPSIVTPAPGDAVSVDGGVTVFWTVPAETLYVQVDLESIESDPTIERSWTAVVPPDVTEFRFGSLPDDVDDPIGFEPGDAPRPYRLTVTAFRIDASSIPEASVPYQRVTTRLFALHPGDLGVSAVSSVSLDFSLMP
jgi:hypothetical protein